MKSIAERLAESPRPLLIGHRGYASRAPENTLPSFQLALAAGADLIELDYHHSRDGVPVVIHDRLLDRTTDARKKWKRRRHKVSLKTVAELQTLDVGSWFDITHCGVKISTLAEALEFICSRGGVPLIEHKSGNAETLVKLLHARNLVNRVVVISFDWKFLRDFHALEPRQVLGALGPPARLSHGRRPVHVRRKLGSRLADLAKTGARIAVWNRKISKRSIRGAQARGLKVWVYTLDDAKSARKLLRLGVDGIITNRIEAIRPVVSEF